MNQKWQNLFNSQGPAPAGTYRVFALALTLAIATPMLAVENIPQKPFAQSVWLPPPGQFLITPWYQYSEFFHIWRGSKRESIESEHLLGPLTV